MPVPLRAASFGLLLSLMPHLSPAAPIASALETPLDPAERETLLRLGWRTLVGHLTDRPIQDGDLEGYNLTPRLLAARGCFVTLMKSGGVCGLQGEIEPTRPLYQQVILFTRRAATRDPRFLPLTDLDRPGMILEIAVIGRRERLEVSSAIDLNRQGIFLEKWGRRAVFLPGVAVVQGWGPERTLQELCRQASLPASGCAAGARVEAFEAEVFRGPQPDDGS